MTSTKTKTRTLIKKIHGAAFFGHLERLRELLSQAEKEHDDENDDQADGVGDRNNEDAHFDVTSRNRLDINTLLDKKGQTPLHIACHRAGLPVVQYLVEEQGANVDAVAVSHQQNDNKSKTQSCHGQTPLQIAIVCGKLELVQYLIQKGADVNRRQDKDGSTPLHLATQLGRKTVVQYLVEQGANVHAQDSQGKTPLHWACDYSHQFTIVQYLVQESHASVVTARDKNGDTPLCIASQRGTISTVYYLLQHTIPTISVFGTQLPINESSKRTTRPWWRRLLEGGCWPRGE